MLFALSSEASGPLYHLKWRVMDPLPSVLQRLVLYLVINLLVVKAAR